MRFSELVDQATELLRRRERISYRGLRREFGLDAEALEDLKAELIEVQRLAADEDRTVLVWVGKNARAGVENRGHGESAKTQTTASGAGLQLQTPDARQSDGERRQLTVLFCDLVGSTRLAEQLDPEEWREIVRAYQHASAAVIEGTREPVLARVGGHAARVGARRARPRGREGPDAARVSRLSGHRGRRARDVFSRAPG